MRCGQGDGTLKQERGIPDVALLLLGEFQRVAEDLERRLFITESTCLGRLTVEREHLPKKSKERHTDVHTGHVVERKSGNFCGVMCCGDNEDDGISKYKPPTDCESDCTNAFVT